MMENTNVKFNVAKNAEAKKVGNVETVEFEITFEGVPSEVIAKHAVANMIVAWQSQIRNNWDKFTKGELPKVVTFGEPLFEGRTKSRTVTKDDMRDFLNKMIKEEGWTMDQVQEWLTSNQ